MRKVHPRAKEYLHRLNKSGVVRRMARWRRISRTDTRVWTAVKYGCSLLNEKLGKRVFRV